MAHREYLLSPHLGWCKILEFCANDITQAEALIAELPAGHVLADKGYDAKALRATYREPGCRASDSAEKNIATGALRFCPLL